MPLSLVDDVKTVSELKKSLWSILDQVRKTGRPVVVTVNGKPDMVLLSVDQFEKKLKIANLVALLARGEQDVRRGRTRPARAVFKALRRAKGIPG